MSARIEIEPTVHETQAARILGCTVACLRAWRQRKRGVSIIRVGRLVRYRPFDLAEFMDRNRIAFESARTGEDRCARA